MHKTDRPGIGVIGLGMAVQPHAQALLRLTARCDFIAGYIGGAPPKTSRSQALAVCGLISAMLRSFADGAAPPVAGIDGPRAGR